MSPRDRCVDRSWDRHESLAGTASTVRRWLLVEQPGPWGVHAVRDSRLPVAVVERLQEAARSHQLRVLLVRRRGSTDASRTVVLADSDPAGPVARRVTLDRVEDLLDLDLDDLGPSAVAVPDPMVLVCTNGRHDACCAEFGRPLVGALAADLGAGVWEVSHIGGDRFAPNVLTLPHGLYHGRVPLDRAGEFAAAVRGNRVWLPGYRGRSVWPFPVQAAEVAVRQRTGHTRIDDVRVRDWCEQDATTEVRLDVADVERTVVVDTHRDERSWCLTCRATEERHPPVHEVRSIT